MRVQRKTQVDCAAVSSGRHGEAEAPCETLHAQVAVQRFAAQLTDAATTAVADQALQQQLPESLALDSRGDNDRKVRESTAGISNSPNLSQRMFGTVAPALDCQQRHFAIVVDLGKAGEAGPLQVPGRVEKAHAGIFGGKKSKQFAEHGFICISNSRLRR